MPLVRFERQVTLIKFDNSNNKIKRFIEQNRHKTHHPNQASIQGNVLLTHDIAGPGSISE